MASPRDSSQQDGSSEPQWPTDYGDYLRALVAQEAAHGRPVARFEPVPAPDFEDFGPGLAEEIRTAEARGRQPRSSGTERDSRGSTPRKRDNQQILQTGAGGSPSVKSYVPGSPDKTPPSERGEAIEVSPIVGTNVCVRAFWRQCGGYPRISIDS